MSKDDRSRIVPLQFIADRRVLGGIPGGGEVAIGRDDPRSRKHALPRHATVLALQGPGDARLPLATRRKAYVAAFRAVDLVVIAPPGEKSHTQAGPGADHSDGGARFGLAGLQRLEILGAQERNAVADRGEVVDEGARRDPDVGGDRVRVDLPREVRGHAFLLRGGARHPDARPLRSYAHLRDGGRYDRGESRIRL